MKRTIGTITGIVAIAAVGVTYGLSRGDVEVAAESQSGAASATTAATTTTIPEADVEEVTDPSTVTTTEAVTTEADSTEAVSPGPVVDGTTYTTDNATITIAQVTSGSGSGQVTYYVADVQLAVGATLQTALAGGGRDNASDIAAAAGASLAINADYFASRDDGIIIRDGVLYRDVPVRAGLAFYSDGRVQVYEETQTSAAELLAAGVTDTLSFGPALLVDGELGDNLDTVEVEAHARHPIQGSQPRAGIGIVDTGHFVFVVVDGRSPGYSRGVTLTEFAEIFADLGCTTAYNLDGGGSATLVFQNEVVNIPLGRGSERAVGDIIYVA